MELWNRRQAADKALAALPKAAQIHSAGFAHELADCSRGIAFAYRKAETSDWRAASDRAMDEMLEGLRGALT